ncbi:MAG: glycosyltransferase [Methanobacteriaceae archaeon]|nr:glycosyltransferase [Methanobacteriaceae archaeon]
MSPKVSIIVPMYGVEQYVEKCIESLLNQTLKEIEIILVDDGSPDRSGEIAEEYAKKDRRIKVVHQRNAGLGPARNSGVKVATGEYIGFVDSDDWANCEMFVRLYEAAVKNSADIVVSGHCDVTNGVITKTKKHPLAGQTIDSSRHIMEIRKNLYGHKLNDDVVEAFPMSVWIAIYRREMFIKHNLEFKEILSEDIIYNLSAYKYAKIITFTGDTDYCYRKDEQPSITQTFSEKKLLRYQDFLTVLAKMALTEDDEDCIIRAKRTAIDYCRLYVGIVRNSNDSFKKKKEHIKRFSNTKQIRKCWEGYPVEKLPLQQRIFHTMIEKECYASVLFMDYIRQGIKKGLRK